jgi:decaprenylphospho-beta-D-ribofuranose 2-oxidase
MLKQISNWNNYPIAICNEYTVDNIAALQQLIINKNKNIARGNGRCYGDASIANNVISTLAFNKILFFDKANGIIECEAGVLLSGILKEIIPHGWFLPVVPGTKYITVGGAVASNIHGKNHCEAGCISNYILEIKLAVADGSILTCSPILLNDLFYATCGGMGLTGIVTQIKIKLKKIETAYLKQKNVKVNNFAELFNAFETNQIYSHAVAWLSNTKKGKGIVSFAKHAAIKDLKNEKQQMPFAIVEKKKTFLPIRLINSLKLLNKVTINICNFIKYNMQWKNETTFICDYNTFFFPLDNITDWQKLYGKNGFIQYQFVLPIAAKDGIIEIANFMYEKKFTPFLSVLKKMGQQGVYGMSFPMEGYSLAVDFAIQKNIFLFLDELDTLVIKHGGRLYLTKDARMKPMVLRYGYPNLQAFLKTVKKYNSEEAFSSALSERLLLTKK